MDPLVLAAATALVGAMATDAWQQARTAITGLWRRAHPRHADEIGSELDALREQVLQARTDGDASTERALEGVWQLKLQGLLRSDPALAADVRRIVDEVLAPALPAATQQHIGTIILSGTSHDYSTFNQIGTQINYGKS
jgi:hypothetical protein